MSLESGVNNIYLITDGTAVSAKVSTSNHAVYDTIVRSIQDHTHDFLLSQLSQLRMWYGDTWKINTVAFHCSVEYVIFPTKKLACSLVCISLFYTYIQVFIRIYETNGPWHWWEVRCLCILIVLSIEGLIDTFIHGALMIQVPLLSLGNILVYISSSTSTSEQIPGRTGLNLFKWSWYELYSVH